MSVTIRLGTISKRRNSTKQPADTDLADVRSVDLKDTTSYDAPTFLLTGNDLADNYLKWGNRYYFINDVRSVRHNLMEVECVLDVLATYKSEILASTQFVSYSASHTGDASWLVDSRIPIKKNTKVNVATNGLALLDAATGCIVLSVVGKESSASYWINRAGVDDIISEISNWQQTEMDAAKILIDGSTTESAIATIGEALVNTGFIGNAYSQAPSCIRACIWVPFMASALTYESSALESIWLGNFDTHVQGKRLSYKPTSHSNPVDIPWEHTGWLRSVCDEVYLYLPLVGMVQLSTDCIINETQLHINHSVTPSDGVICYEVTAGNQIVGTYGASCAAQVPIGINQKASAGELFNSIMQGERRVLSTGVESNLSPLSAASAVAQAALEGVQAIYDTVSVEFSSHATSVGGLGGGAGAGLDLDAKCFVVSHDPLIDPADMAATMGRPVMKPMSLSGLTGYCQCANGHVSAPAQAGELDALDHYLNSGFYIE